MVIGIIALLIAILLPSLQAARRAAVTAKCLSNLRSIGQALNLYAVDNKGYWPACEHTEAGTAHILRDGTPNGSIGERWSFQLLKYMTPRYTDLKVSVSATGTYCRHRIPGTDECAAAWQTSKTPRCFALHRKSSCRSSLTQRRSRRSGYGMNEEPIRTPNYPPQFLSAAQYWTSTISWRSDAWSRRANECSLSGAGQYFRASQWGKQGAERIVVGDSRSYTLGCTDPIPATGVIPPQSSGINNLSSESIKFDRYRHGDRSKNRVTYNALYCDGHAVTLLDEKSLLLGTRRIYPG